MSDIIYTLDVINHNIIYLDAWLKDYVSNGLQTVNDDIFDLSRQLHDATIARIQGVEGFLVRSHREVVELIEGAGVNVNQLTNFVQNELYDRVSDTNLTVQRVEEKLEEVQTELEEIPKKTAEEVSNLLGDAFDKVANSIDNFSLTIRYVIQEEAKNTRNVMLVISENIVSSIDKQSNVILASLNESTAIMKQTIEDTNEKQVESMDKLRDQIVEQLQAIAEGELEFQQAIILFLTNFWDMYEATTIKLRSVTFESFQGAREEASELTVKLPDKPSEPTGAEGKDMEDYLEPYEQQRYEATGEQVT